MCRGVSASNRLQVQPRGRGDSGIIEQIPPSLNQLETVIVSSVQGLAAVNHHPVKFVLAVGRRDSNGRVLIEAHRPGEAEALGLFASPLRVVIIHGICKAKSQASRNACEPNPTHFEARGHSDV